MGKEARLVAVTRSRISHAVTARLTFLVRGGKYFGANSAKNAVNLPLGTGEILVQRLWETVRRIKGLKARRWSTNGRAAGLHKLAEETCNNKRIELLIDPDPYTVFCALFVTCKELVACCFQVCTRPSRAFGRGRVRFPHRARRPGGAGPRRSGLACCVRWRGARPERCTERRETGATGDTRVCINTNH